MKNTFKHVNYLWDESKAATLGDDEVALFLYRSNIFCLSAFRMFYKVCKKE